MITAPFNFVPLSENVFFPEWSEDVSHDVPFVDGESGVLDITLTAKSPIFVRDAKNKEQFCSHNGEFYIPSTSVKGMVRNVLEIMSFSKMNLSSVDDKTYAVRDLRNRNLYMSKMKPNNIFCGWLKKSTKGYTVEDCGIPGRIKHEEIDNLFKNKNFASKFKSKKNGFVNKPEFKTAMYKYNLLQDVKLTQMFDNGRKVQLKTVYKKGSIKEGTLVLTGQASARKDRGKFDAKVYEFIFFKPKKTLLLDNKVFEDFKFAYFDGRTKEPKESFDWGFWKKVLNSEGKVPIFFQKNRDGEIEHFGLSYLYKLPYKHSIHHGIGEIHKSSKLDLAETIFGYANDKKSLKGRASFSHFKAEENIETLKPRTEILGTPRASYYPIYIMQDGKKYLTYMDNNFSIAGRKRYPVHKETPDENKVTYTPKSKQGTSFRPLKEKVIFKGKLRYHNLKKIELGAILSALTFHNTSNTYHSIGLAKSLGYGKIEIKIDDFHTKNYLEEFERFMSENIQGWQNSSELTELLTMATQQNNIGESALEYMSLDNYSKVKNSSKSLKRYSKLQGIKTITLTPLNAIQVHKKLENSFSNQSSQTISNTQMRKAISDYFKRKYDIYFHKNQIEEFFSTEGFKTTPPEQQEVYNKNKDDKNFLGLLGLLQKFTNKTLEESLKIKLYAILTKKES